MRDLKIQLIQTKIHWENKHANFNHLESVFFNTFKEKEIDLIILPEMFNSGFSMQVNKLAEKMDGESINWLLKWAKKLNCCIGGSLIIEENNRFFNRFVIVSQNGVEAKYDKRHLFRMASENDFFSTGENRIIFNLKGWKLMLQVCYDLRFPVFARNKLVNNEKEYDALIYVANWPSKRAFIWKNLIQARAIENQAYCIGVNRVGEDGNQIQYEGNSMCVDPWGNITTEFEPFLENNTTLILKKEVMATIKKSFPAYLDADLLE